MIGRDKIEAFFKRPKLTEKKAAEPSETKVVEALKEEVSMI